MAASPLAKRYLKLLANSLRNSIYRTDLTAPVISASERRLARGVIKKVQLEFAAEADALRSTPPTADADDKVLREMLVDPQPERVAALLRANSSPAHTLLDDMALCSLADAVITVVEEEIPGDLIECGVFRGGASIFMKGVLTALGVTGRKVWLADSFKGLPQPDRSRLKDAVVHEYLRSVGSFQAGAHMVRENFQSYGLLDDTVQFLEGWFEETLPGFSAPLAVLRCDGDWYASTRTVLECLYDRVSPGGFIIIDDYHPLFGATQAVDEFRARHGISSPLIQVWGGVHYWRKAS